MSRKKKRNGHRNKSRSKKQSHHKEFSAKRTKTPERTQDESDRAGSPLDVSSLQTETNVAGVGSKLEQYLKTRPRWTPSDIVQGYNESSKSPKSAKSSKSSRNPAPAPAPRPAKSKTGPTTNGATLRARLDAIQPPQPVDIASPKKVSTDLEPTVAPQTSKPDNSKTNLETDESWKHLSLDPQSKPTTARTNLIGQPAPNPDISINVAMSGANLGSAQPPAPSTRDTDQKPKAVSPKTAAPKTSPANAGKKSGKLPSSTTTATTTNAKAIPAASASAGTSVDAGAGVKPKLTDPAPPSGALKRQSTTPGSSNSHTTTHPQQTSPQATDKTTNGTKRPQHQPDNAQSTHVDGARGYEGFAAKKSGAGTEDTARPKNEAEAAGRKKTAEAADRANGAEAGGNGGSGGNGHRPPPPGANGGSQPREPQRAAVRVQGQQEDDFRAALARAIATARANLASVLIFSLVVNLLILSIPIYLFQVSDRVLTSRSVETLIMLTAVVIGALAIYALLDIARRFLLMRVAVAFETTIGGPVVSAAAKAGQQGSTREFQMVGDLQQLRNFITGPTLLAFFDAPIAPVYFLAVYLIHPHLGIIVTVASMLLVVIAIINQTATAVPFARANAFNARANFQAEAMARNGEVLNAMGMIREGVILWGREMAEALKSQVIAQDRNVLLAGLSKFLRLSTQVAMLCWGAYLALDSQLTGGMMIAASIIGSRALAPVEGLIEGWRGYVQARGGYARIKALLNASPLNHERLQLPRPQGALNVERVLFVPPPTKKVILNGINFSLPPGESLAIVGPSGTGKSTLARMLVGAIAPTSGSVRLDLMDIRNWDPRQFGETVGYLPQEVQLFPGTVKANIARLREDVTDESIYDAAELAGVHEMISQLPQGYETAIGLNGNPLSGGQKQRLGLARAFFGSPRLVVLDEPNSNLDTAGEIALSSALKRAKRKMITVVAVTQRPSLLRSVDKIMLIKEGRIQHIGPRNDVIPKLAGQNKNALPNGSANGAGAPT